MQKVLIAGGNGLVGRHLTEKLLKSEFEVSWLSRNSNSISDVKTFLWDIKQRTVDKRAFENIDYIINLSGENIGAKRWTAERKNEILNSRVLSTRLLFDAIKENKVPLKAFISASAVGYYGAVTVDKIFSEEDVSAPDFLGTVCKAWEDEANKFNALNIRTIKIRTGLVLTKRCGALEKIITPIKFGLAVCIGNGQQFMPWIHIDDLCGIYLKAITDSKMQGTYNAVAPEFITNTKFTEIAAELMNKPFLIKYTPPFIYRLALGEMASLILAGSRVSNVKIEKAGYRFKYTNLKNALQNLLQKT